MGLFGGFNKFFAPKKTHPEAIPTTSAKKVEEPLSAEALEAERGFKERAGALESERRNLYNDLLRIHEAIKRHSNLSNADWERENRMAKNFSLSFLETSLPPLAQYAKKPETFPEDRFKISVFMHDYAGRYMSDKTYRERGGSVTEPVSRRSMYLDAPFAFTLLYKKDDGSWEPISTIGFMPDLTKNVLMIDQLQGGDTSRSRASDEGRRVRMKFAKQPEEILYEVALDLATRADMRGVGLRKSSANQWGSVRERSEEGKPTPYDQIAATREMRGFASKEYFLEPIGGAEHQFEELKAA